MALVAASIPFARILSEFVSRVATALGVSDAYIRPVANDDYPLTEYESLFAFIRPYGPYPANPTTGKPFQSDGAGRWRRVVGRRVRVYVYTRSGVDSPGGDEVALGGSDVNQTVETPATMPGQFALEEAILSALDDWYPTYLDDQNVERVLTIGPIRWIDSADGPPVRKPENEVGLVRSHLDFELCYTLAQLQGEPSPTPATPPNPGT